MEARGQELGLDSVTAQDPGVVLNTIGELVPACVELINAGLLRRDVTPQPIGLQGRFRQDPKSYVNASASHTTGNPPEYLITAGALLAILDLCMEIASQPHFLPEVGRHFELLEREDPPSTRRFRSYAYKESHRSPLDALQSVPRDRQRQKIGWYLFSFALRFVALHEQGHYLSGHILLYPNQQLMEISEQELSEKENTVQGENTRGLEAHNASQGSSQPMSAVPPAQHCRVMEIEADSFAHRNASLLGVRDWDPIQQPDSLDLFLPTPADWCSFQFLGAATVGLLLSYISHAGTTERYPTPLELRTHPSPECRLYGLMMDLTYIRSQTTKWHGEMLAAWEVAWERMFVGLQAIADVLGENVMVGFQSALNSYVHQQPGAASQEYEELVKLLNHRYEPLQSPARNVVAEEIGGPILT